MIEKLIINNSIKIKDMREEHPAMVAKINELILVIEELKADQVSMNGFHSEMVTDISELKMA